MLIFVLFKLTPSLHDSTAGSVSVGCLMWKKTHPHLAQVPVVIVRLILVGQFSAQDDAVLPTLKTFKKKQHTIFFYPHSHCQGASCLTSCSAVGAAKMHAPHWVAPVSRQYQESNITSSCRYMQHPAILLIK